MRSPGHKQRLQHLTRRYRCNEKIHVRRMGQSMRRSGGKDNLWHSGIYREAFAMNAAAYYNEIDPFAAQWLRNLIAGGHIAPGEVDERSIEDVSPDDLRGFTQCHLFAGIGVWSHSLRLAGWPDDKPVWTGSCPCQPFSAAGKGDGFADERHLWPHFFHLISERRPEHVFGEQVASGNTNAWFDLVQADLEGVGYAFGLVPFTSAGVGAPHIRERAYWVAHASSEYQSTTGNEARFAACLRSCATDGLADASGERFDRFTSLLQREESGRHAENLYEVAGAVLLTGWITPTSRDWRDSSGMTAQRDGKDRLDQLPRQAFMTGWPTPTATNNDRSPSVERAMSMWRPDGSKAQQRLQDFAGICGPLRLTVFGEMRTGSYVEMANGVQLNPAHSRWLMGLPRAWDELSPGWQEWQAATASVDSKATIMP